VVHDAAVQRLVGVVWFLSACGLAAAVAFGAAELYDASAEVTVLTVGMTTTLFAGALWVVRKRALQHLAMFGGLVVVIVGAILTLAPEPAPSLAFALALWAFGLGWALLAWRRLVEPLWVGAPLGVLLALLAPSFGVSDHGWLYAIGILTAGAAMALSVPLRNTPLLGLGTVATFAYVTSMVVRYFSDSLGVPATLAITGFVVLVLATVSARLVRTARPQKPEPPKSKEPPPHGVASPR
jgi:hypothetical protein